MNHEISVEKEIQLVKETMQDVHRILTNLPEYDPHQPIKHLVRDAVTMSDGINDAINKLENVI